MRCPHCQAENREGRRFALIEDRFAETRAGDGQAVFVFGEAGIGKSRLLLEFRSRAEAAGARWLVGRCVSYGRGIPYLPLLDITRDLLGINESDRADQLVSVEAGRYLADHIPGAQFQAINGGCHAFFITRAAEFAQAVRRFVRTERP